MAVRLNKRQHMLYGLRLPAAGFTHRFFFFVLLQQAVGCPAMGRRRLFLCLAAAVAACCCLALLVRPVHGATAGLVGAASGGRHRRLSDEPRFHGAHHEVATTQPNKQQELRRGVTLKARWSSWSSPVAAGSVRSELRSVPGGPDPLHHHGSPRRPEQEGTAP